MEVRFGPSDKWEIPPETMRYQEEIEKVFRPQVDLSEQPPMFQVDITQRWIDWAAQNGDKTYKKYRSTPLIPPYVQYQESVHSDKDFTPANIDVYRWDKKNEVGSQKQSISVI